MNRKEADAVLEVMAIELLGALAETQSPTLEQRVQAINTAQAALRASSEGDFVTEVYAGMTGASRCYLYLAKLVELQELEQLMIHDDLTIFKKAIDALEEAQDEEE